MLATVRLAWGVNAALHDLQDKGRITVPTKKLMGSIAGSDLNRAFGVALLKSGAARSRHAAAVAVFARLVGASERAPTGEVTADDWRAAARQAFLNAGASEAESFLLVATATQQAR